MSKNQAAKDRAAVVEAAKALTKEPAPGFCNACPYGVRCTHVAPLR
jgi:hypothetical protein